MPRSDVACFNAVIYGRDLAVRYADSDHRRLLVTYVPEAWDDGPLLSVYSYDLESGQLSPATESDWRTAQGKVMSTVYGNQPRCGWFAVINSRFRARPSPTEPERTMETRGEAALEDYVSPDGERIAVFSTDGWPVPAIRGWFFNAGGGWFGQTYVEIFDTCQLPTSPTVSARVPFAFSTSLDQPVWTEDGRYFVVSHDDLSTICLIPAE